MAQIFVLVGAFLTCFAALAETPEQKLANEQTAAKVAKLFEQKCANCHSTKGPRMDAGLDLLDFARLRQSGLLDLKAPENSELIRRLKIEQKDGGMPKNAEPLATDDIALVQEWIRVGAPTLAVTKPTRSLESIAANPDDNEQLDVQIARIILDDLTRLSDADANYSRYLTLTHLWAAGESEENMETYRQGLVKLVNSLSQNPKLHHLVPIDKDKTIFRFRPDKLSWRFEIWNELVKENPYQVEVDHPVTRLLSKAIDQTPVPYMRADWFAFTTSRSPNYEKILRLGSTAADLENTLHEDKERQIKFSAKRNIEQGKVARAGFRGSIAPQGSKVSTNNRMIERHETRDGAYWRSYDFNGNAGDKDLFKNPLSPGEGKTAFNHAGGEVIFHLENGLQAYWLEDKKGSALPVAPNDIVTDANRRDGRIFQGISCMGCHTGGLHPKDDEVLARVLKTRGAYDPSDLEKIKQTYKPQDEMRGLFEKDNKRYRDALAELGVKETPGAVRDSIRTLTDRFERIVNLDNAAAEVGFSVEQIREAASHEPDIDYIVNGLDSGGIPRDAFIASFQKLARVVGVKSKAVAVEPVAESAAPYKPREAGEETATSIGLGVTFVKVPPTGVPLPGFEFITVQKNSKEFEITQLPLREDQWLENRDFQKDLKSLALQRTFSPRAVDAFVRFLNRRARDQGEPYEYALATEAELEIAAYSGYLSAHVLAPKSTEGWELVRDNFENRRHTGTDQIVIVNPASDAGLAARVIRQFTGLPIGLPGRESLPSQGLSDKQIQFRLVRTYNKEWETSAERVSSLPFEFVTVEPGAFDIEAPKSMGSTTVRITLRHPYRIAKTEVTQGLWQQVMGRNEKTLGPLSAPVTGVSYRQVQVFLSKLNQARKKEGDLCEYGLPSSAEWELAMRGRNKAIGSLWTSDAIRQGVNYENVSAFELMEDRYSEDAGWGYDPRFADPQNKTRLVRSFIIKDLDPNLRHSVDADAIESEDFYRMSFRLVCREPKNRRVEFSNAQFISVTPGEVSVGDQKLTNAVEFEILSSDVNQLDWGKGEGVNRSRARHSNFPVTGFEYSELESYLDRLNRIDPDYIYDIPSVRELAFALQRYGGLGLTSGEPVDTVWEVVRESDTGSKSLILRPVTWSNPKRSVANELTGAVVSDHVRFRLVRYTRKTPDVRLATVPVFKAAAGQPEFEIMKTQVMRSLWADVMQISAPIDDAPKEAVTGGELAEFIRRLNAREARRGVKYRLPNEKELELAVLVKGESGEVTGSAASDRWEMVSDDGKESDLKYLESTPTLVRHVHFDIKKPEVLHHKDRIEVGSRRKNALFRLVKVPTTN